MCACMSVHMCGCLCTCRHAGERVPVYECACVDTSARVCVLSAWVRVSTYMPMSVYARVHACVCAHVHGMFN